MLLPRMLLRVMMLLLRSRRRAGERPVGIPCIASPNPTLFLAEVAGSDKGSFLAPNVVLRLAGPLRDIAVPRRKLTTASLSFDSFTRATL